MAERLRAAAPAAFWAAVLGAACGPVLGTSWWLLAPPITFVVRDDGVYAAPGAPIDWFGMDGWFLVLGLGFGVLLGLAGFWFRGGPGIHRTHRHPFRDDAYQQTETHWLLEADALFVFAPVPVVALLVGPVGDVSFVGYHTEKHIRDQNPNADRDSFSHPGSYYRIGAWAGLAVFLW